MYKYVHLMFNDKFNKSVVDFLNKHFNPQDHLFLCKRFFKEFPFPTGANVMEIQSLYQINWNELHAEKIICHSLFDNEVIDFLFAHKEYLKKAVWIMWGGDFYKYPEDEKNIYVRQNFAHYVTNYEKEEISAKLKIDITPYRLRYNFPVNKEILDTCIQKKHDDIVIQINNSADDSTLEVLACLRKFADENIRIRTILSYGKLAYKDIIIQKGKEYFGDKFEYLDKILSPKYYANYLAENDILILNQDRSQGVGNTLASLYLGKKIFIRREISTATRLEREGFVIYDTNTIKNLTFAEFVKNDYAEQNKEVVKKSFDEDFIKSQWEVILAS